MGGLLEDDGGFTELGGVGPLLGVGGRGLSLLWLDEEGAFGVGGALPRPPRLKGGGGGGAEVLCFIPLPKEAPLPPLLLPLGGRERSGREGRWVRWSDGAALSGGEGETERPVGGRGAAALDPGGRRADLPTDPPAEPSDSRTETKSSSASSGPRSSTPHPQQLLPPTGRSFGTPP